VTAAEAPILTVRGISKTFGPTRALRDFSLDVQPGTVHGLIGQNGSGKSTFIKILAGFHEPDDGGSMAIRGNEVSLPLGPRDPAALGISILHQDLALVDSLSIVDNLSIGRWAAQRPLRRLRWRSDRREARRLLARFDLTLDPDAPVSSLPGGERAILAIARALDGIERAHGAGLLVLDEATAALPDDQVERLFAAVRRVANDGSAVLFVSHRLNEITAVTDHVTVLRDGVGVGTVPTATLSERELIRLIVGRDVQEVASHEPRGKGRDTVLEVQNLRGDVLRDISFEVDAGEVVGITGLVGMGQDELPGLLFGAETAKVGTIRVNGVELRQGSPRAAMRAGVGLVPAHRLRDGAVAEASVMENVTLPTLRDYFRKGRLDHDRQVSAVGSLTREFAVRPDRPQAIFGRLSGGNQQKALLGKWMALGPRLLILHEPAHGVDIGARREIFNKVLAAAHDSMAVVIVSSEHNELAQVASRVLVMYDGVVHAELSGDHLDEGAISAACYGHAHDSQSPEAA
jgi:ribose transport system ATP-binding protein